MNFQQFSDIVKHPLFLVMWLSMAVYSYYYLDLKLAILIHDTMAHHQHDIIKNIFQQITQLGNSSIYLTLSLLLILFALLKNNQKFHTSSTSHVQRRPAACPPYVVPLPRLVRGIIRGIQLSIPGSRGQVVGAGRRRADKPRDDVCLRDKLRDGVRLGIFIFFATAITGIACNIIKMLAGRARPVEFFSHDLYGFYFWQFHSSMWSFPSGHATIITAVATTFSLLLPRFWGIFFSIALLVDASRVILLAHFVSDTMIGSYLGFIITDWLYQRYYNIVRNTNGKIPP